MFSKGIWATTVTPFDENGYIDESSLRRLTDFYINSGVHGLSLGVLGEVDKLSDSEKDRVVDILVEQTKGKVPVSVVCSAQNKETVINLANKAEQLGAQAVMIAPPKNLNDDEHLFNHFFEISNNVSVPIIVQDNPSSTGSKLSSTLLAKMANEIKNIQYVKLEESPTTVKISNVLEQTDKLKIVTGTAMFFYEELERGAVGTMSGFPFPEVLVKTFNLFYSNKKDTAREYFYKHLPLMRYDEILPHSMVDRAKIKKEVFRLGGIIKSNHVRTPSSSFDQTTMKELKEIVKFVSSHI